MLTRSVKLVFGFTCAYLLLASWFAVRLDNTEFVYYCGIMAVLIIAAGTVHRCIRLHDATLWGLSLWGLLRLAGGMLTVPEAWPRRAI